MHELNVMLRVLDEVEAVANENHIPKVKAIVLDIGELSPIVPSFMTEYYPLMIEERPIFENCKLVIERTPGIGKCKACGTEYNVVEQKGYCPCCHEFPKEVLSGNEFMIKEIQVPY